MFFCNSIFDLIAIIFIYLIMCSRAIFHGHKTGLIIIISFPASSDDEIKITANKTIYSHQLVFAENTYLCDRPRRMLSGRRGQYYLHGMTNQAGREHLYGLIRIEICHHGNSIDRQVNAIDPTIHSRKNAKRPPRGGE